MALVTAGLEGSGHQLLTAISGSRLLRRLCPRHERGATCRGQGRNPRNPLRLHVLHEALNKTGSVLTTVADCRLSRSAQRTNREGYARVKIEHLRNGLSDVVSASATAASG
jgi:hypothetical protein